MSRQCLPLCHDNVTIKVSLLRLRRPRQKVRCRTLHAATEFGQGQGFLCHDRGFHVATGFDLNRGFLVATKNSLSRQGLSLVREFSCRDGEFDVAIGLDKTNSFSVTTV